MSNRGAEFRKADFQIHSPRDDNWDGARPEDGLSAAATSEDIQKARGIYCRNFISKCVAEGLRAIAITDHHEGVYSYRVIQEKAKLEAEKSLVDLWVFPGMELTCKDACQALIIFDANLPIALFEKARAKLGLAADTKPDNPKGIKVDLLVFNIAELQGLLDADPELRDRFIIFPHVKPGGHKTVLRAGFHKRFKDLPYVGGYMDQCYPDQLSVRDRKILDGEIPAWASEKRGVFSCSDARHADFRLIGKHATWIKLASPTAESLRQAMLAPDSRIRYEEPKLPSAIIASVKVQGSKYLKDGTYNLNQQMNSVIGGRGAGKSTLLEYVRFALGCSAIDGMSGQGRTSERLQELLLSTLDQMTGTVSLNVLLNGAPVVVTREMAKRSVIKVDAAGSSTSSSVEEVRRLIPTQQYRQGELSELAREDAANRLLQLVTGQAASQIAEIEAKLKKNSQSLSESLAKAVRLSAAKLARAHADTQTKLLKAQIENLQKQLTTGNQPTTPAIADHDKYLQQQAVIESTTERLKVMRDQLAGSLNEFAAEIQGLATGQPLIPGIGKLTQAFDMFRKAAQNEANGMGELAQQREQLMKWFDTMISSMEVAALDWKPALEKHQADYDEQKKALQGKQSVLDSIESLNVQLRSASQQLDIATVEEAALRDADKQLDELRKERVIRQTELHVLVGKQIATIKEASSNLARGQLSPIPDFTEPHEAIRKILELPLLRETRIDALVNSILVAPDVAVQWKALQDEMIALVKWKEGAPNEKGVPPATPILHAALEDGFMEKLRERISADRAANALQAILRPRVEIFQLRDGAEIEFRKASQGEQAATLLNILMNQSNGPLIIDQPEEDLDNRIINDIIRTIRKTKAERQLILATHNANIAVNGDSENVIEMVLGERRAFGAIDEPEVRDAITKTMEGGKDAFELRRKKYNF
jgi:type III restriction enzyme